VGEDRERRILSGLQPSAGIHLGNYLGAIRPWVAAQDAGEHFFFLADMHAITLPKDPRQLRANVLDGVAMYLACGLNPQKAHIFLQSHVIGHTELAWVLGCLTPLGQLERMTQFKDKSQRQGSALIGAGLFYYPILMAADILLYRADRVPVGEDQRQHLELARDLAERFNGIYSPVFPVPQGDYPPTCARVMSLQEPAAKMSKSDPHTLGTIFIADGDDQLRKKFRGAVTDSGREIRREANQPGICNLLNILSGLLGQSIAQLEEHYAGRSYAALKDDVADAAIAELAPIREKFQKLQGEREQLLAVLERGRERAQAVAQHTLAEVYRRVGFVEPTRGFFEN
jgi:tryptophanyl-tRNA synthetase